jgi:hypothetical protein
MLALGEPAAAQQEAPAIAISITYSQNYDPTLSPNGNQMIFTNCWKTGLKSGMRDIFRPRSGALRERESSLTA